MVDDGAGEPSLDVQEQFTVPLAELRKAYERTLPVLFEN